MMQVIEQTTEEKLKMYMKCTKQKLAEMLIECNRITDVPTQTYSLKSVTPHCCPVCSGNGKVPNGFYGQTNGNWSSSDATPEKCNSCNGTGIVWG